MAETERRWQPVKLPGNAPAPVGAYSPAVRAGDFVFVSGQVPKNPSTGTLAGDDIESQTTQVLSNVKNALAAAGASLDDVVSVTVYLTDVDLWARFNAVYKEIFRPPYPSRTAVGADLRGILIEVSAVAYVGPKASGKFD